MIRRPLIAALVCGVLAGCSSEGEVRDPAELKDIVSPALRPAQAWNEAAGNGADGQYSGLRLALETDALFAADVKGRVYAFSPQTGKPVWRADTRKRVISGPTVSGNAVLVGTLEGEVIALKRSDGTPLWEAKVSSEVMAPPVSDGTIVVARSVDGRVFALSAANGSRLWAFDRTVPNLTLRGLSEPLIHGGRVFIGMDNGRLAALRATDGSPAWEQAVAVPSGRSELERITDIDAPLLGEGRDVYAASFGGEVVSLDGETGDVQWRRSVKSYTGMALIGTMLALTDDNGVVWGLDAGTGAAAWKLEDLKYRRLSAPAAFGDRFVVGDYDGYLHWLDPKDGRVVARTRAGSDPILSPPVASADMLYVLNANGRISAVRAN